MLFGKINTFYAYTAENRCVIIFELSLNSVYRFYFKVKVSTFLTHKVFEKSFQGNKCK